MLFCYSDPKFGDFSKVWTPVFGEGGGYGLRTLFTSERVNTFSILTCSANNVKRLVLKYELLLINYNLTGRVLLFKDIGGGRTHANERERADGANDRRTDRRTAAKHAHTGGTTSSSTVLSTVKPGT